MLQVLEDINHILIYCLYANACWNEINKLNKDIAVPISLTNVVTMLSTNQVLPLTKSFISFTAWII